jgi:mycoredoxin
MADVRRCEQHGLAAGPDGTCARCRKATPLTGVISVIGVGCVLAIGGLVAFRSMKPEPVVAAPLPVQPAVVAEEAPPPPARPAPVAAPGVVPTAAPAAPPPPPDESAQHIAEAEAYVAAARKKREDERVAASVASIQVEMYSTSWCGYCAQARAWMNGHGVAYSDHDVERDPAARARKQELSPGGGVPVFEIDGLVLKGFSAGSLQNALAQAAARRAR